MPSGDLPPAADYDGVYYLQRYIESGNAGWHDWRVFVIDGIAVAAMKRQGKSWITNVSQGGTCAPVDLSEHDDLRALAQKACCALQMDYAGVDLIRDRDGHLQVIEVNGIPAWKGLQSVSRGTASRRCWRTISSTGICGVLRCTRSHESNAHICARADGRRRGDLGRVHYRRSCIQARQRQHCLTGAWHACG